MKTKTTLITTKPSKTKTTMITTTKTTTITTKTTTTTTTKSPHGWCWFGDFEEDGTGVYVANFESCEVDAEDVVFGAAEKVSRRRGKA